jgi:hypothetical protein
VNEHRSLGTRHVPLVGLGYRLTIIFLGTLFVGILGTLAFSASACLISHAIRCFSISRDLIGLGLFASKDWALPAFLAALLVVTLVRIRGSIVWWNILAIALVAMFGSSLLMDGPASVREPAILFIASLFLFMGVQTSLLIGNWFGKSLV